MLQITIFLENQLCVFFILIDLSQYSVYKNIIRYNYQKWIVHETSCFILKYVKRINKQDLILERGKDESNQITKNSTYKFVWIYRSNDMEWKEIFLNISRLYYTIIYLLKSKYEARYIKRTIKGIL